MQGKGWLILCALLAGLGGGYYYSFKNADDSDLLPAPTYVTEEKAKALGISPQTCSDLQPLVGDGHRQFLCPPGHAFFATDEPGGTSSAATATIDGRCCRLPADDILTEDHVPDVLDRCPDQYVVTGGTYTGCASQCAVRCTKINTGRYRLGPKKKAFYYRVVERDPGGGRGWTKQIPLESIPAAIRYGSSIGTREEPDSDGCVGIPFGALLVEKKGSGCSNLYFSELRFRDTDAPVAMFPDCDDVTRQGNCFKSHTIK